MPFIYNLFLFLATRDTGYAYYVAYLISVFSFAVLDSGPGLLFFDLSIIGFDKKWVLWALLIAMFWAVIFISKYLDFRKNHPVFFYIVIADMATMIASLIIANQYELKYGVQFSSMITAPKCIFIMFMALYSWHVGNKNAPYLVYAWCFNVSGLLIFNMVTEGHLPAYPIFLAALPLAIWLEAILLSQALADRIKKTEKEALLANRRAINNLALYRSVFDNALEGLYQMNLRGKLLSVNPSLAKLFGYSSPRQMIKHSNEAFAFLYPDIEKQLPLLYASGIQTEIDKTSESGHTLHALHSAHLVCDDNGSPLHIEGTLIDIRERKKRELAQFEQSKERRERMLAENISNSKSEFLKTMSYEIRTPLSEIIGFAESIRYSHLNTEERRDAIDKVNSNSHHLLQLINDILDFSKIEAGKMSVEHIPVEVSTIAHTLEDAFTRLAEKKRIKFILTCFPPMPKQVLSDPTRIKQIMQNLCNIALKNTPQGEIKVELRWDKSTEQLSLEVRDTSIGINLERLIQLQRSSQAFLENEQQSEALRIALTQQLAKLLDGQLNIHSSEGLGTQYLVQLNCGLPEGVEWITSFEIRKIKTKATTETPRLQGRILLAEDNPVNQKLIQRVIIKTGAELVMVSDGAQALEAARSSPFDLILMDVNMPVMGGLEATQALRASGYEKPIYALTAEHGQQEIDASLAAGCNGHLLKPLELTEFYLTLSKCLKTLSEH